MAIAAWLPGWSAAQEHSGVLVVHVTAGDPKSLLNELLALTQKQLLPANLVVDSQRAWLSLSDPLPAVDTFEVRPAWRVAAGVPPLPLGFLLRPRSPSDSRPGRASGTQPIQAALGVRLLQEVLVATRRLRKGSVVGCADLGTELRDVRDLPKLSLTPACAIDPHLVARRDIAAGDVMRSVDIGPAPDVAAGMPVQVSVSNGAIAVSTTAIALADAKIGDQIEVRLQRPTRTLKARVTAPGSVQIEDGRR